MSMTRWDPFREMMSLREAMNRMFDERVTWPLESQRETQRRLFVPVDMYETAEQYVIAASLPGAKPEDVRINLNGNVLTLEGELRPELQADGANVHFRERAFGSFQRVISLPNNADPKSVNATFEDGVLRIEIAKAEEAKPKRIQIKAK